MLERRVALGLKEDGAIAGRLDDRASGQMAVPLRRLVRTRGVRERRAAFERWLSQAAGGARIVALEAADDSLHGEVTTNLEFELTSHAQLLQGRLLMFRPFLYPFADGPALAIAEPRHHPIVLSARALRETVLVRLPAGFRVDELPVPITLDATFGRYAATVRKSGADLELTRVLEVRADRLPADLSSDVRDFYRAIRKFEESPVVLTRD